MSRIRTVKPEFWSSEQVMSCSVTARLLFIGLWNFCDDHGVHPASCKSIKAKVFPSDNFSVEEYIAELVTSNLLEKYDVEGKSYLKVVSWAKHQRIDRPTYVYPLPQLSGENSSSAHREFVECSSSPLRMIDDRSTSSCRVVDESSTTERNGKEWNGKDISYVVSEADDVAKQKASSINPCLHNEIIALYHEILPACRKVRRWTNARQKLLQQRWKEDVKHQSLEFWRTYFEHVFQSEFLMGRVVTQNGRVPFLADLEWLIKPSNFTNVIEGKYHGGNV